MTEPEQSHCVGLTEIVEDVSEFPMSCSSWNLAAVNNNPFEYWVSSSDTRYDDLMNAVQEFVSDKNRDVPVGHIFTDEMFADLIHEMEGAEIGSIDRLRWHWTRDYKNRLAIAGFLKDKTIGTKRLTSMPDRITNTINLLDGTLCCRPSPISAYQEASISSIQLWWPEWKKFMFHRKVEIFQDGGEEKSQRVFELLCPILRSKYPAITVEEQEISVQLQILCLAILDAIFIFVLRSADPNSWEEMKTMLCDSLITNKAARTCDILAESYFNCRVFFVQEAAAIFVQKTAENIVLSDKFVIVRPTNLDGKRNQNSLILLHRDTFLEKTIVDLTQDVMDDLDGVFVAAGDLVAVTVQERLGRGWFLVSFHGDSNGLSTQPVLQVIIEFAQTRYPDHLLLCGLDANTHSASADCLLHHVDSFARFLSENGLASLWGPRPDPDLRTAFSCRTYLQTQLNKAVPMSDRCLPKHQNLKDWIVCFRRQIVDFSFVERDNTGARFFAPDTVLPSVKFPSDHTIISTVVRFLSSDSFRPSPQTSPRHVNSQTYLNQRVRSLKSCNSRSSRHSSSCRTVHRGSFDRPREQATLYDYWGIGDKPATDGQQMTEIEHGHTIIARTTKSIEFVQDATLEKIEAGEKLAQEELRDLLYRRLVSKPRSNDLDRLNMLWSTSTDRSIWILFSQRPASMVLCKAWFQALLLAAALAFLAEAILNSITAARQSTISAAAFRFVPLSLRNGQPHTPGPEAPSVHSVGVLQEGTVRSQVFAADVSGPFITVNLSCAHPIDGFLVVTGGGPSERDPVRYRWETWDDVAGWREVTYPPWLSHSQLSVLPSERFAAHVMKVRPPTPWLINRAFGSFLLFAAFVFAAACGMRNKSSPAIQVVAAAHHLFCLSDIWLIIASDGGWLTATYCLELVTDLCISYLVYNQKYFVDLFVVSMSCVFSARIIVGMTSFAFSSYEWKTLPILILSIGVPLLCSVVLAVARAIASKHVFGSLVEADRKAFNEAWKFVMNDREECDKIHQLKDMCRSLQKHSRKQVRQRLKRPNLDPFACQRSFRIRMREESFVRSSIWGKTRKFRFSPLLMSLDQLYDQAVCLDYFLKLKVIDFASASNGLFRVKADKMQFASWEKIVRKRSSRNSFQVLWTRLKAPERALEKLVRSYDCDVSRLLDYCRESIYFERTTDLLACIERIITDPDIRILRIKNRLDPNADTIHTAGFRNVVLNLCIESDDTRRLGVEGHVCELLLTFTSFARLIDEEVHQRYIILRNCRDAPYLMKRVLEGVSFWAERFASLLGSNGNLSGMRRMSTESKANSTDAEQIQFSADLGFNEGNLKLVNRFSITENEELGNQIEERIRYAMTSTHRRLGNKQEKDQIIEQAVEQAEGGSVWDTVHPFAAALYKPWIPCLVVIMCCGVFVDFVFASRLVVVDRRVSGVRFRFTALEVRGVRGRGRPAVFPGISALGVFSQEDPVNAFPEPFNFSIVNATYTISFARPVEMNGWWFETSAGRAEDDPVRFRLEYSEDGAEWVQVGSSGVSWTWEGSLHWTDGYYWTSGDRGRREMFGVGVPWVWSISYFSITAFFLVAFVCLLYARLDNQAVRGKSYLARTFFASQIVYVTQFSACLWYDQEPMAWTSMFQSVIFLISGVVFGYREAFLLPWIGAFGSLLFINIAVHHFYLVGDQDVCYSCALVNEQAMTSLSLILVWLIAYVIRLRSLAYSRTIVAGDMVRYKACWAEVVQQDESQGYLHQLEQTIADIKVAFSLGTQPRQRVLAETSPSVGCSRTQSAASVRSDAHTSRYSENITDGQLVQSLEQLFAQGAVVDVWLRSKLKDWAVASEGLALARYGDKLSFVPWSQLVRESAKSTGVFNQVQFARLKTTQRATEKVYRAYNCQVSRLLDVCRQSLYFTRVSDILACLKALAEDPEVRIQRVVNKLRPDFEAESTLGYRDVLVNLCLDTEESRRLGVNRHVCELQLVLVSFARIKTDAGHARYVQWRNQRAA